jgi:hypothetical protein
MPWSALLCPGCPALSCSALLISSSRGDAPASFDFRLVVCSTIIPECAWVVCCLARSSQETARSWSILWRTYLTYSAIVRARCTRGARQLSALPFTLFSCPGWHVFGGEGGRRTRRDETDWHDLEFWDAMNTRSVMISFPVSQLECFHTLRDPHRRLAKPADRFAHRKEGQTEEKKKGFPSDGDPSSTT